jgi:hypothetical protein
MIIALVSGLLFIGLNVLRLTFVFNSVHSFLLLNALALGSITLVGIYRWRALRLDRLEWLMLAALGISFITADYSGRQAVDIAIDILRPLFFLGSVITLRHLVDMESIEASPILRKLLVATVPITLLAIALCYVVNMFVKPIYPAYSSIDSLLGLGWLMATTSYLGPLLFSVMLFVSGKRGVYLVAFLMLLLFYRHNKKQLAVILVTILVVFNATTLLHHLSVPLPSAGTSFVLKATNAQVQSATASASGFYKLLAVASGGRLDEILDATAAVKSPYRYVFGEGPGFSYYSKLFEDQGDRHRNLHFTPLSIIIYYGGVFAMLFACYLLRIAFFALRVLNNKTSSPLCISYAVYMLGSLVFCLTEFSVFAYANFAISCGLIAATARSQNPSNTVVR